MTLEQNKETVRRFFLEGLDGDDRELLREIFIDGAKRHFPGRTVEMKTSRPLPPPRNTTAFRTELHQLFGEGDYVAARITHYVTYGPGAEFICQAGSFACNEKSVQWDATVVFRFEGDQERTPNPSRMIRAPANHGRAAISVPTSGMAENPIC